MGNGIYALVSGSKAQEIGLEVLSHNLSNLNTTAFKAERPLFDLYVAKAQQAGSNEFPALDDSSTVIQFSKVLIDFSQGTLKRTNNNFDLALQGDGFFSIDTPEGVQYTRAGNFRLNAEGQMVTQEGFVVRGKSGPIIVNGVKLSIDRTGNVMIDGVKKNQLNLVDFPQPYQLVKANHGFFMPKNDARPEKPRQLTVQQGFLERSNVNTVQGMVRMIQYQRSYEAYQNSIKQIIGDNGITADTVNDVGTVG